MKISANHLKRYREIATLLWRYGRSDLVQHMGADEAFAEPGSENMETDRQPETLADDLEAMGPTYVKIGQILAGRPDLLPEAYVRALARLQDRVKPFPFADVERIVSEELGARMSKAFSRFDAEPLAAASLGQVHAAALRDGRPVVVKVQRPDIRPQIAEDFEVLEQIASFLDDHTATGRRYRFRSVVEEFRLTIRHELNYEREAQNLIRVGKNLEEFELIVVPQPVLDYTTPKILTMDFVQGRKVTKLSPLARLDLNGDALCDALFAAYLKQVLTDGLFHADPHPGNVFVTDDGRIALLDLGMVGHTSPGMQENLLKLLIALSDGDGEKAAEIVLGISEKMEGFDPAEFRRRISRLVAVRRDQGLEQLRVGRSLIDVSTNARDNGLFVPSELTLLGKTLAQLDEVGRILAPDFNPNASIRRNLSRLMSQRVRKDLTQGNIFSSILEMRHFLTGLPARFNRIMDAVADAELEVKVKSVDTNVVMEGMQKIANRVTSGLILAALIVGASFMMRVETRFQLFGYPGLAITCFLIAAIGALWLLLNIFFQDQKSKKNPPR